MSSSTSGRLADRVAIVTGAGRGIGRAIALAFAAEGASVVVASRTGSTVDEVVAEITGRGGDALGITCDVGSRADVDAMVAQAVAHFAAVDILVNNAHSCSARRNSRSASWRRPASKVISPAAISPSRRTDRHACASTLASASDRAWIVVCAACTRSASPTRSESSAHAQFETIHPFPDGNGRVGRALMHSILKAKELTRKVTVPVSAGLLADLASYFDALTEYRGGDHEAIVRLTAEATFRAIGNGRALVHELHEVNDDWRKEITARKDAAVWRLADLALRQPVLDSEIVQRELDVAPHNANAALALLEDIGALKRIAGNHRYRKWAAKDVLDALDRFAERAGRRQPPPR